MKLSWAKTGLEVSPGQPWSLGKEAWGRQVAGLARLQLVVGLASWSQSLGGTAHSSQGPQVAARPTGVLSKEAEAHLVITTGTQLRTGSKTIPPGTTPAPKCCPGTGGHRTTQKAQLWSRTSSGPRCPGSGGFRKTKAHLATCWLPHV